MSWDWCKSGNEEERKERHFSGEGGGGCVMEMGCPFALRSRLTFFWLLFKSASWKGCGKISILIDLHVTARHPSFSIEISLRSENTELWESMRSRMVMQDEQPWFLLYSAVLASWGYRFEFDPGQGWWMNFCCQHLAASMPTVWCSCLFCEYKKFTQLVQISQLDIGGLPCDCLMAGTILVMAGGFFQATRKPQSTGFSDRVFILATFLGDRNFLLPDINK